MRLFAKTIRTINSIPVGCASALIAGAILTLTLMPAHNAPAVRIPHADKLVHFIMFGVLSMVYVFDSSRYTGRLCTKNILLCALLSSVCGGVIELLQAYTTTDRSGDWYDLLADVSGAFAFPFLFKTILSELTDEYVLRLVAIKTPEKVGPFMHDLYISSFPEDERRPWKNLLDILATNRRFNFTAIYSGRQPIGFISWWRLDSAIYIEHFAIDPAKRSKGLGAVTLERFKSIHRNRCIVLEAEPACASGMAARRIGFYKRCGFVPHHTFPYVQPPYSDGLQPVELTLLTCNTDGTTINLESIASEIRSEVYGVKNSTGH